MESIIQTSGLHYRFGKDSPTLLDINLTVPKGSIYGFLGPNGSGKTTTLSLLLGLRKNQHGTITILDKDLTKNRIDILKRVGSLIESPSLYGHLSATENLNIYRKIYGVTRERINEVLEIVGLQDVGNKAAKKYSLGMKQRLALALALLPNPELLILDEPTNGLDPTGIVELRELIKKLNRRGLTIMVSSHILSEVEKMVSHVGIIFKGKMIFQGPIHELQQIQQNNSRLLINTSDNLLALSLLQERKAEFEDEVVSVPCSNSTDIASINRILTRHQLEVYSLRTRKQELEQLFISLTTH